MDAAVRTAAKRRLIALAAAFAAAAALCLVEPAGAIETEGQAPVSGLRLPAGPTLSPLAAPSLPSMASLPALPALPNAAAGSPYLSQPSHLASPVAAPVVLAAGSPSADPHAAETPRPAGASAGLQSVARSLANEQRDQEPSREAAPSAASRAFFDGGLTKTVKAAAVVAGAVTPGGFGMPATYALARYTSERAASTEADRVPLGRRLGQNASAHLAFLAMGFPALLVHKLFEGSPLLMSLAAALLAYGGAAGVESMLGETRRRVVGGWQASHDQKYRHDLSTGRLVDIRGKKYGEDRYEEYASGPVSAGERLWARLAATGLGALLLSSWSGEHALIYSAALTAAFALGDALAARRGPAPERVFSDEERAHAARFLRD